MVRYCTICGTIIHLGNSQGTGMTKYCQDCKDSHYNYIGAKLSNRELQTLKLVSSGMTNQQVSNSMNISIQTAKNHMRKIMLKLQTVDRTSSVVKALQLGYINLGDIIISR